jgi:hypothetical protein
VRERERERKIEDCFFTVLFKKIFKKKQSLTGELQILAGGLNLDPGIE